MLLNAIASAPEQSFAAAVPRAKTRNLIVPEEADRATPTKAHVTRSISLAIFNYKNAKRITTAARNENDDELLVVPSSDAWA